ncbi:uncharacterized protein LOC110857729 [Folsomia candida]|uniref:Serum amyloid A-2 protein n=1 Tax=Folsomia candida TaxID=158441 RepID=A0A226DGT3_FOLCA|nr:uncharacterized protein LOC110857729 [Folsomia candida]OXA44360.1 Serum amyloid A-2 protein [Folsomia candida]
MGFHVVLRVIAGLIHLLKTNRNIFIFLGLYSGIDKAIDSLDLDARQKELIKGIVYVGNYCSVVQLGASFTDMLDMNCIHDCDKYFHCQGNYNAVYKCKPEIDFIAQKDTRELTAKLVSDLREYSQIKSGRHAEDSAEDEAANMFGRGGGNCAEAYLKPLNCSYDPETGWCGTKSPEITSFMGFLYRGASLFGNFVTLFFN